MRDILPAYIFINMSSGCVNSTIKFKKKDSNIPAIDQGCGDFINFFTIKLECLLSGSFFNPFNFFLLLH